MAIALGGGIVLLLLGTQVLSAAWLLALFGGALLIGWYRSRARLKSPYQIAQGLDQHLHLHDQLSTAVYFREHADAARTPGLISKQRQIAEEASRSADIRSGLPFVLPRSAYATTVLAAAALTVFGVRYGVTKSLDLRPSLVQIAFNGLMGQEQTAAADKNKTPGQKGNVKAPPETALKLDPWETKTVDQQGAPDSVLNTVDTPDVNNSDNKTEANAKANGTKSKDPLDQQGEPNSEGEKQGPGDESADSSTSPDKGGKDAKQPKAGQQQNKESANSSGENASLADKMRDALSNLMSKLKMQQKPGEGKPGGNQPQQSQQSAQKQGKDDKGQSQPGKPQSDAQSSQDQQGDQEGQTADKAASAQNKSGSKSSDKPPSQDGKSGVGKEDGDKSAREAEQLAAMGKISEIVGKRAQNMTGEVMVEVSSGKQQLKTQYSQRKAAHADAGGEINRDEVPLAYQQFVQQYFEEVHKAPPTGQNAKSKKPSGT